MASRSWLNARRPPRQLLKTGLVDESRVAAIGFCFGGAVCQTLAYSGARSPGSSVSWQPRPASPEAGAGTGTVPDLHGALDPFSTPEEIAAFKKSLDDGKFDYQFITYPRKARVHQSAADAIAAATGLNGIGYNEPAARRSWQQMRLFFDEIFATNSNP